MGLHLQCLLLESWRFVLDAVGRRSAPSRECGCGGGRGVLCPGQGCSVHRTLLQDIKDLYFRTLKVILKVISFLAGCIDRITERIVLFQGFVLGFKQ